jgi:hypothetical protein
MGLYFSEGGDSDKVLGLTCHRVLFKTDATTNDGYTFAAASASRKYVQLLGTRAFDKLLASIKIRIGRHGIMVEIYEEQIKRLKARLDDDDEDDVSEARKELKMTQGLLDDANKAIDLLVKSFELFGRPREVLREGQEGVEQTWPTHQDR